MHAQDKTEHPALATGENAANEAPHNCAVDERLAKQIEAALKPLRGRLSARQVEIVRTVLWTSVESDPVSRLLAQRFGRTK